MKNALYVLLIALLLASAYMAVGCGGSEDGDAEQEQAADEGSVDGGDEVEDLATFTAVGTYQSADGKVITLKPDGTFESDAWGSPVSGTYLCADDELGKWVDLAFEDGSSISMSAMLTGNEVAAIVDVDTGTQYTRK